MQTPLFFKKNQSKCIRHIYIKTSMLIYEKKTTFDQIIPCKTSKMDFVIAIFVHTHIVLQMEIYVRFLARYFFPKMTGNYR